MQKSFAGLNSAPFLAAPPSGNLGPFLLAAVLVHALAIGLWPLDEPAPIEYRGGALDIALVRPQPEPIAPQPGPATPPTVSKPAAPSPRPSAPTQPPAVKTAPTAPTALASGRTHSAPARPERTDDRVAETRSRATSLSPAQAESRVRASLDASLRANFDYPLIARKRGWEGLVRLRVHIEADGRLSAVRILETSGYAVLDRAARLSVERILFVPEAAAWLQGRGLDMVLPVQFKLVES